MSALCSLWKLVVTVVLIGADYVVRRRRYCDDFVMVFVCVTVCEGVGVVVRVSCCYHDKRKPLIVMS